MRSMRRRAMLRAALHRATRDWRTTAAAAVLLGACAAPVPRLTEERTFDGLVRVENTEFDGAWVRPDLDVTGYTKLMFQEAGIEYRPAAAEELTRTGPNAGMPAFAPSDHQKARLRDILRTAFVEEMAKSRRFQLVEQPGPGVLLLRGSMLDVVSFAPPDEAGMGSVYLRSVGEATLVLELRDSQTEAILARVCVRRAAERMGGPLEPSNSAMNGYEVDRVARLWARISRERLDALRPLGPPDA
jgi:hypothetical protein